VCNRKIQWPTIPVWWQKKGYCSDTPNVVSAIDGTSREIQIQVFLISLSKSNNNAFDATTKILII
jgi:hypothetical protein